MDGSPAGSSFHGILQARILEWVAIAFSRRSTPPKHRTHLSYISCLGRRVLYHSCPLGSPFYIHTNTNADLSPPGARRTESKCHLSGPKTQAGNTSWVTEWMNESKISYHVSMSFKEELVPFWSNPVDNLAEEELTQTVCSCLKHVSYWSVFMVLPWPHTRWMSELCRLFVESLFHLCRKLPSINISQLISHRVKTSF